MTSETDYDALSEPYASTKGVYMGHISPKDTVIYQKGLDPPIFSTLKELTNEAPWGDT